MEELSLTKSGSQPFKCLPKLIAAVTVRSDSPKGIFVGILRCHQHKADSFRRSTHLDELCVTSREQLCLQVSMLRKFVPKCLVHLQVIERDQISQRRYLHTFCILTFIQSGRTSGWKRRACEKAILGLSEHVRICSARLGRCSWN
jgi:hypothetical protein